VAHFSPNPGANSKVANSGDDVIPRIHSVRRRRAQQRQRRHTAQMGARMVVLSLREKSVYAGTEGSMAFFRLTGVKTRPAQLLGLAEFYADRPDRFAC
jgi:hypothetical protein